MKQIITILIICCFGLTVFSQELQTLKLDNYFQALEQNNKVMGTVCVSRDGVNVYSKSTGFSNIESRIRATQNSTYKIGSISKSFTAVMIFQAVEEGKLKLSTTLDHYFPTIKNSEKITIDYLLCHRSGIHNFTDNNFSSWSAESKSREDMLKIMEEGGSDFKPDSKGQYSNSNYVLLSYILEIVYKKPFAKILQNKITNPLKLANTYFGKPKANLTCNSYVYLDKWRIESDTDPSVTMGAGGIVSTTSDLNVFFYSLFNDKLISQSSLAQMKTITEGFGRGLFQMPFGAKRGYGHSGGIDGFNSVAVYFPDDKIAYSLTSNGTNFMINNISIAVLSGIYNLPFDIPVFKVVNLTSEDLDKYLGVYSSAQLPLKITVSKRDKILVAQGTGQPSFDLEASAENTFQFEKGGIILVFNPNEKTMMLKQGGASFLMKKE